MKKILIVDDEPDILEFLTYNLIKEGFDVSVATNGVEALKIAKEKIPDLIILDVMMPEMDGIETCRQLREISLFKHTIIIFLSARSEDYTQVAGLETGADDYIVKPVKLRILLSKINSYFRRIGKTEINQDTLHIGALIINRQKYIVTDNSKEYSLPKKEFELLYLLASKPNIVLTRDAIYTHIWGDEIIVGDRTIDVHIRKLRDKFGDNIIKTIKGVGYKFEST